MTVSLLHHTPITNCDLAISKCWDKPYDAANVNYDKIDRIANKFKHESTIEHIVYQFDISGVSRALLQEQARHRMASYSVKSTRYTLSELKQEPSIGLEQLTKYCVLTGIEAVDLATLSALENLYKLVQSGISNDYIKYALPEAYKTSYVMTINARSLRNFIALRSSKSALWEIRLLAQAIYNIIPDDHKFLFHLEGDTHDSTS